MSKKKIFYALSVFLILGMTMSALNVRAHQPINIDIKYYLVDDPDYPELREKLSIRLTHGVSDPIWEDHDHNAYFDDQDNYALAVLPTVAPTYTFNNTNHPEFDRQPTDVTDITVSHTLPIVLVEDPTSGELIPFLGEGRTNITVSVKCSLGGVLTEHYYVGQPYYNPHLTFAEAAMPATISTIVVVALLFILPKLGQKNAPKLEIKSKH